MEESITYRKIKELGKAEGHLEEARRIILRQGKKRFGHSSRKAAQAIEAISDLQALESLADRVHEVNSWDVLLGNSGAGP